MKRLFLIKNPEVFQGERYLKQRKRDYFEGWYFKNTSIDNGISFIPGININKNEKKAFIQVITNDDSYFVDYDIDDFEYSFNPFFIKIGNNFFSKDKVHIDIVDTKKGIIINGDIKYSDGININISSLNPNIMGLFSYIPFMECNHAVISMKNTVSGLVKINDKEFNFDNGIGYIEKDWGCSFPKSYVWCQGNNFYDKNVSFMFSVANVPFKFFHFNGIICSLIIDNEEYRFATYNNTKIVRYKVDDNSINIILKKKDYYLYIEAEYSNGLKLIAPIKGKMNKDIIESISAYVTITLVKDGDVIFSGTSTNCGLEIVY